jgi:hypothetical protein
LHAQQRDGRRFGLHPVFGVIHDLMERHASPNVGQHEEVGRVEIDPFLSLGIEEHDGIWVELQVPRGRGAAGPTRQGRAIGGRAPRGAPRAKGCA